jgi:hypothetical protein
MFFIKVQMSAVANTYFQQVTFGKTIDLIE